MKKFTQLFTGFLVALTLGASSLSATSLVADSKGSSAAIKPADAVDTLSAVDAKVDAAATMVKLFKGVKYKFVGNRAVVDSMYTNAANMFEDVTAIRAYTYNTDPSITGSIASLQGDTGFLLKNGGLDSIINSSVVMNGIENTELKVATMKMNGTSKKKANAERKIAIVIGQKLSADGKNMVDDTKVLPYVYSRGLDNRPGYKYYFVLYKQPSGKIALGKIEYRNGQLKSSLTWDEGYKTVISELKFYNVCDSDLAAVRRYQNADCTDSSNPVCRK